MFATAFLIGESIIYYVVLYLMYRLFRVISLLRYSKLEADYKRNAYYEESRLWLYEECRRRRYRNYRRRIANDTPSPRSPRIAGAFVDYEGRCASCSNVAAITKWNKEAIQRQFEEIDVGTDQIRVPTKI